jgi:NADPH-dependent F420 reductase
VARPSSIAFVGGTGKLGRGLGLRLAAAGHRVELGSRVPSRAEEAAAELRARLVAADQPADVEGAENAAAVRRGDVVFLTLPFDSLEDFVATHGDLLAGKVVVDVVNPLRVTPARIALARVPDGAVGPWLQRRVPRARVVSAFKNAAAAHLLRLERPAAGDVLIATDDAAAGAVVRDLVRDIPHLRPIDAGRLANSAFLESLTALELDLNRIHKTLTSIRILGIEAD